VTPLCKDAITMSTDRMESVGREIQKEIGKILRTEVDDPLIGFVTITGVEVSADLKHAQVFFSAYGEPDAKEKAFKGLKRACKFIRHELAERLQMRYVPKLRFEIDETPERAQRIEQILRAEADARAPSGRAGFQPAEREAMEERSDTSEQ
jgi:ribosome-binding factor A